ncbi:helix-turn-helix transcriptional regulator [Zavarzinia compransoris]|uniref:helix-turn-helix transcriptional regulator n=1 Tax=Zavarzinia marina TaxID=2911065 RepID=UPI001F206DBE|nr:helix-turn-helix transcriptional regulator [Zavarzinia marina]MCF4166939.1 helix-turn-helix transcriptional regulator [Zavarzinia marina]
MLDQRAVTVTSQEQLSLLIGHIYQGSFEDVSWKQTLELLREYLDARFVTLSLVAKTALRQEATINVGPIAFDQFLQYENEYQQYRPNVETRLGEVYTINDWLSLNRAEFGKFNELLEIGDINHYMGAWVCSLENVDCFIRVMRARDADPFVREEANLISLIAPHFARALDIRSRLAQCEIVNQIYADAMDRLAVGGIVLDENGKILVMNAIGADLMKRRDGITMVNGMVHAVSTQDDRSLQALIRTALAGDAAPADTGKPQALTVARSSGARDLGLVINRIRLGNKVGDRWRTGVTIFIRDPENGVRTDPAILKQLFGFTQAESALATQLAKGESLDEAAVELNIRYNTARAHLRSMFAKTGVTRQAELVRILVNGVAPLGCFDQAS